MKIKRTQEEWRILFAEQRARQLSVTQFCEQHHIPVTTFYNCRAQLEKHILQGNGNKNRTHATPDSRSG